MTNHSTVPVLASSDIAKRQKTLKVNIYDWRKKGYNVSRFSELIQHDIAVGEEEFEEFLKIVHQMEKIEERLYRLDTDGFDDQVKKIEEMIKDPDKIEKLEKEMILLEENILRQKIESSGTGDKESVEATLTTELDKIRAEELHRIREEEGDRLREQERKKILKEELHRIREEERERLKKTELDRIRREEKERLVWEDRVVRQLRLAKTNELERAGKKKMKCPSCKGIIPITSDKRPLKVRCQKCGKDYTLRSKGNEGTGKTSGSSVRYKKCPKCNSPIPVVSDKRPLKIICQVCDSEYLLKSRKNGDFPSPVSGPSEDLANQSLPTRQSRSQGLDTKDYGSHEFQGSGRSIACPTCNREIPEEAKVCGYCGSPIEHSELEKKQPFPCPNCGKEIPGDARICGYCGSPVGQPDSQEPVDDFELPLSPNEKIRGDLGEQKTFKPLNDYSLPNSLDLSGPGPAPPGSMERFGGPTEGITCSKCGNLVSRGVKFCGVCGNSM